MTKPLRRWVGLSRRDRLDSAEAWLLLLLVDLALRWLDLRRAERLLDFVARLGPRLAPSTPPDAVRLRRWVSAAAGHQIGSPRCLHRSLALRTMLRRRHCSARLRIGVRHRGEQLEAHAWLEIDGVPLSCEISSVRGFRALQSAGADR